MAESSSLHGISRGVASKHWYQRVLWFLVFFAATGGAIYQLSRLFSSYSSYPVKTSVELKFSSLSFPAVSFCNMNPIKMSKLGLASKETIKIINGTGQLAGKRKKRDTSSDVLLAKIRYFASKKTQQRPHLVKGHDRNKKEPKSSLKNILHRVKRSSSCGNGSMLCTGYFENSDHYDRYMQSMLSEDAFVQDEWNKRVSSFRSAFQKNARDIREDIGHNISDMLLSCAFDGKECYAENFTLFQSLEYGNCYTIESSSFVTKQSGPLLGLRLTLNIETSEYIDNYMDAHGVRLVIHEPGTLPFPEDEGFTLNPSYETTIGMRMLSIHRASQPHGNCDNGEDFMRLFGIRYTIPSCLKLCKQREIMERCSCLPSTSYVNVGNYDGYKPCSLHHVDVDCEKFVNYQIENQLITCNCLSPCKQFVYKTSLSGRKWPSETYMSDNLMKDLCHNRNIWYFKGMCENLKLKAVTKTESESAVRNFLKTEIYYEDLNYEIITEEPLYDGFQLISDIGGALGLFMGASIISFVEVLAFIIEVINFLWKKISIQRIFTKSTQVLDFKEEKEHKKDSNA